MIRWILGVAVVLIFAGESSAWPFRGRSVSVERTVSVQRYSSPQAACEAKAAEMARIGRVCHVGGGFAGGTAEGVGGGATAAQASANCCFSGQLPVLGHAVAFGHGRWFAVKIYAGGSRTVSVHRTRSVFRR